MCFPQVSALDREIIEVDTDSKEMLKLLVRVTLTLPMMLCSGHVTCLESDCGVSSPGHRSTGRETESVSRVCWILFLTNPESFAQQLASVSISKLS